MKEKFDLDLDAIGASSRSRNIASRQVRRHDVPDPTPSDPFEADEEKIEEIPIERDPVDSRAESTARRRTRIVQPKEPLESTSRNNGATARQTRRTVRVEGVSPRVKSPSVSPAQSLKALVSPLFDRRLHIFFGVVLVVVGIVMAVVLVSHLRNAGADQNRVLNETVTQMAQSGEPVKNAGAAFGAWLSHVLFADSLGLGAFVVAIYLLAMGTCLIARLKVNFWAFTFKCLLLATAISVISGLVTFTADSAVFWGGTHGHYVNKYLNDTAGFVTMIAVSVVLLAAVVCAFYYPIRGVCHKCKQFLPSPSIPRYSDEETTADQTDNIPTASEPISPDQPAAAPSTSAESEKSELSEKSEKPELSDPATPSPLPTEPMQGFTIDEDEVSMFERIEDPVTKDPVTNTTAGPTEPSFEINAPVIEESTSAAVTASTKEPYGENYDHRSELPHYVMPPLDILEERPQKQTVDIDEQQRNKDKIVKTLANYKIEISSIKATVGPTVTLYEVVPAEGIRIAQIKNLEDDIAMSLSATGIRIIAPMPGKGTVGIEVPNSDPQTVSMRSVLASKKFQESTKNLPVALGATIQNEVFIADLASMPHALVAGATGQGKSVGLNAIIASLLYKKHPSELKFVLIDPKMVEFSLYAKLQNHYLAQLPDEDDAIITDSQKVLAVLNSLTVEMENRLRLLKDAGVRDIIGYNEKFEQNRLSRAEGHHYLPYIVVIIDEFADLILTGGKEIEGPVARLTAKARAIGIHLIIATQRPSTNVLTGIIKANCPARIAFRTQQMVDSRTILDRPGANHLIGRGDMLYSTGGALERMQCAFISTDEVEELVEYVKHQPSYGEPYYLPDPKLAVQAAGEGGEGGAHASGGLDRDVLFDECARFIVRQDTASTSSLQRRFEIGYNRAGKIMDQLEAAGVVSAASGSKPRNVLMDPQMLEQILSQR